MMNFIKKFLEFLLSIVNQRIDVKENIIPTPIKINDVDIRDDKFARAFEIAKGYAAQGINEADTPLIIRNWWKQVGKPGYTEKTPWCTLAIYIPLMEAGLITKDHLPQKLQLARSVLNHPMRGFKQINPIDLKDGDIVIRWRGTMETGGGPNGWQGHVSWFDGWYEDQKYYYSLGGNQKNGFNRKRYKTNTILGGIRAMSTEEMQNFRNVLV